MEAAAMLGAWHTLQTTGQASARSVRAHKASEPVIDEMQPDTPFQKPERALWIMVKLVEMPLLMKFRIKKIYT